MLAEIAGAERAQQRAGDRVQQHVAVGVAGQPAVVRDLDAAEAQRPPCGEPMRIEAQPHPRRHRAPASSASARARSAAVVILKLSESPATTCTGLPSRATRAASSVPTTPSALAFA